MKWMQKQLAYIHIKNVLDSVEEHGMTEIVKLRAHFPAIILPLD